MMVRERRGQAYLQKKRKVETMAVREKQPGRDQKAETHRLKSEINLFLNKSQSSVVASQSTNIFS